MEQMTKSYCNTADEMLKAAAILVSGARNVTHGSKYRNLQATADLWNAFLSIKENKKISAKDVGIMMALVKIARMETGARNFDDFIDGAGWIACAGEAESVALSMP